MAIKITRNNLKTETQNPLTVIDFWAPWCGPCKMMNPIMDKLETEFHDRIHFGKLNVDHQQKLAEHYTIYSIPSLVIFEHGKAHEKVTGFYPEGALENFLKQKIKEVY